MNKIILSIITAHILSGGTAITVVSRNQNRLKINQMIMTSIAIGISFIQTMWIISKIEKTTN